MEDNKKLNISETLESIRFEKNLKKNEFAKLCGISSSFYSDLIHKKRKITIDTLTKVCTGIGVPIDVFIFKALREDAVEDENKRKLIREIKPFMDSIAKILYIDNDISENIANNLKESMKYKKVVEEN